MAERERTEQYSHNNNNIIIMTTTSGQQQQHSYQQGISMTQNGTDDGNNNDKEENVKLLGRSSNRSDKAKQQWCNESSENNKRLFCVISASVCLLFLVIAVSRRSYNLERSYNNDNDLSSNNDAVSAQLKKKILYRPICEYYDYDPITVIQSSMTHPSQSWQEMMCYPSTTSIRVTEAMKSTRWNNNKPTIPLDQQQQQQRTGIVNVHGAPDAVLLINFTQPAFASSNKKIIGFGGAFTEASALNYNRLLTEQAKDTVMELLFGKTGLGYRIGRLHINSCDFSIQSYSFDETIDDFDLLDFDMTLQHDVNSGVLNMAQRATAVLRESWSNDNNNNNEQGSTSNNNDNLESSDGSLLLFASPWSPPSWMKQPTWQDEKNAVHAAKMTYSTDPTCLRDGVGKHSKYAKAWALYFSKYISAVQNIIGQSRPLWAITVQNEPEFAAPWEACSYTNITQAEFVAYHLGPRLQKDHPNTKLLVFDHNKDHVNAWMDTLLMNATIGARPYVDGTAYHWYAGGMDRLLDGALGSANMHRLQENLQDKYFPNEPEKLQHHIVLGSESCHCPSTAYAGGDVRVAWARAERYAHVLLADLAAGSQGWLEWNLILDGIGGPNHLHNLCESTILSVPHRAIQNNFNNNDVNSSIIPPLPDFETDKPMGDVNVGDGRTREELNAMGFPAKYLDLGIAVQPMYYYMGHFSRHVRPGAMAVMAILTSGNGSGGGGDNTTGRIFRPPGQVVMGGGLNDLAKSGIELTVWPCEGSTRQQFYWNYNPNQKQNGEDQDIGKRILVKGHDWLGRPTTSCIGRQVDKDLKGLRLTDCTTVKPKDNESGEFNLVHVNYNHDDPNDDHFKIYLMNHPGPIEKNNTDDNDDDDDDSNKDMGPDSGNNCLIIKELANNGGATGPLGGAQVIVGDCFDASAVWKLDSESGEISSMYFVDKIMTVAVGAQEESVHTSTTSIATAREEVCLTTGWPFLQAGAFLNPNSANVGKTKTIIVLNEANDPANLLVQDEHNVVLTTSIPARSIQTFVLS